MLRNVGLADMGKVAGNLADTRRGQSFQLTQDQSCLFSWEQQSWSPLRTYSKIASRPSFVSALKNFTSTAHAFETLDKIARIATWKAKR